MSEIRIPPKARKAAFDAWNDAITSDNSAPLDSVILAALKAWPNAQLRRNAVAYVTLRKGEAVRGEQDVLILPLPPEPRDV